MKYDQVEFLELVVAAVVVDLAVPDIAASVVTVAVVGS